MHTQNFPSQLHGESHAHYDVEESMKQYSAVVTGLLIYT